MAWNGSGTYVLSPSFSPEVNGTTVDATRYNGLTSDIAAGITAALAKNGENVPTANLPMGGFRHTGVAAAVAAGQYLSYNQSGAVLTDLTVTTLTWSGFSTAVAGYLVSPGPIGGTTANTGRFSTLEVTTTSTFTGVATFTGIPTGAGLTNLFASPPAIGGTAPAGARFTFAHTAPVVVTTNIDCSLSNVFTITLGGPVTFTISNPKDGQTINLFCTQDGAGNRIATWPAGFRWPGGTIGLLSTGANKVDLMVATYRSATALWYATLVKDFL